MENTIQDTPYILTNKKSGQVVKDVAWTSSTGEGQNFLSFTLADGREVRFNRPEHQTSDSSFENSEYTAYYEPTIPVVETPTETA